MPVSYIDIPTGVSHSAQEKMSREVFDAIHQAWPIPDTRILIREWPAELVSQDGRIETAPMRPHQHRCRRSLRQETRRRAVAERITRENQLGPDVLPGVPARSGGTWRSPSDGESDGARVVGCRQVGIRLAGLDQSPCSAWPEPGVLSPSRTAPAPSHSARPAHDRAAAQRRE